MQKLPEAKPLIAHFSGAALARMSFAAADASRSSGARAESARDEACVRCGERGSPLVEARVLFSGLMFLFLSQLVPS